MNELAALAYVAPFRGFGVSIPGRFLDVVDGGMSEATVGDG